MNRWILISFCLAAPALKASQLPDGLTAGVAEFRAAYHAWDGARFAAAAEIFQETTKGKAASATNYYWLGVAQFHRLLHAQNSPGNETNKGTATAALDAAVQALTVAVELDDRHAESHALLGTLYGIKINDGLLRALRFGPRVAKHRKKALEFGAKGPRVQFLLGMCLFHTATNAEGYREARATLLAAEKLFEAESITAASPLEPRWGYDSCLTFIGRCHEVLGQPAQAADYFRKALALHPADNVAKAGLERVKGKK